jgi:hypothetical protein
MADDHVTGALLLLLFPLSPAAAVERVTNGKSRIEQVWSSLCLRFRRASEGDARSASRCSPADEQENINSVNMGRVGMRKEKTMILDTDLRNDGERR